MADPKDADKGDPKNTPAATSLTPPSPVPPPSGPAPADATAPAPVDDFGDPKRHDETVPGGAYIVGGKVNRKDGKHYGGTVRNAEGEVLAEFADNEVNDGRPKDRPEDPATAPRPLNKIPASEKAKPAAPAQAPAPPPRGK